MGFQEKRGWIGLQTNQLEKPGTEKGQSKQTKHPNCPFTSNKRLSGHMVWKLQRDSCWECHWRNGATPRPYYFIQMASPGQDCNVQNCFPMHINRVSKSMAISRCAGMYFALSVWKLKQRLLGPVRSQVKSSAGGAAQRRTLSLLPFEKGTDYTESKGVMEYLYHAQAAPAFSQTLGKKANQTQILLYFREQQPFDFSVMCWLHSRW